MARKKTKLPILEVPKNATLKQIYAAYRKQFSAADLAEYAEPWVGVPMEDVIARMEKTQQEADEKLTKAKKRKKA